MCLISLSFHRQPPPQSAEQSKDTVFEYAFDARKSREVLGITYKGKEETAV